MRVEEKEQEGKKGQEKKRGGVQMGQSLELKFHNDINNSWRHSLCVSRSGETKLKYQPCALGNILHNEPS